MPMLNEPTSGSIPYATGISTVIRIPIPGTVGLCIEFKPRGYVPKGGSTSTVFFQDISGKRHLRLDYGFNVKTQTIDFHWNQTGTHATFGIADHAPAGRAGARLYMVAKHFRHAGRVLVIVGAGIDVASIVSASAPLKRASEVVGAWALAWAGCKLVGAGGAVVGTLASPVGTAVGGIGGCIVGGYAGYHIGTTAGGVVYDWADATFTQLPQITSP